MNLYWYLGALAVKAKQDPRYSSDVLDGAQPRQLGGKYRLQVKRNKPNGDDEVIVDDDWIEEFGMCGRCRWNGNPNEINWKKLCSKAKVEDCTGLSEWCVRELFECEPAPTKKPSKKTKPDNKTKPTDNETKPCPTEDPTDKKSTKSVKKTKPDNKTKATDGTSTKAAKKTKPGKSTTESAEEPTEDPTDKKSTKPGKKTKSDNTKTTDGTSTKAAKKTKPGKSTTDSTEPTEDPTGKKSTKPGKKTKPDNKTKTTDGTSTKAAKKTKPGKSTTDSTEEPTEDPTDKKSTKPVKKTSGTYYIWTKPHFTTKPDKPSPCGPCEWDGNPDTIEWNKLCVAAKQISDCKQLAKWCKKNLIYCPQPKLTNVKMGKELLFEGPVPENQIVVVDGVPMRRVKKFWSHSRRSNNEDFSDEEIYIRGGSLRGTGEEEV